MEFVQTNASILISLAAAFIAGIGIAYKVWWKAYFSNFVTKEELASMENKIGELKVGQVKMEGDLRLHIELTKKDSQASQAALGRIESDMREIKQDFKDFLKAKN